MTWSADMFNEKLIITAATADSYIFPHVKNWALSTDTLIDDVVQCAEAGAAIVHVHLPLGKESETVARIRERSDVIIQAGMASYPIEERTAVFDARPDMLSIILNHYDEQFNDSVVSQLHPIEELEAYCVKCRKLRIVPEWEVWHMGSYWNLTRLITKKLADPPHVLTLFFGWPGGIWSPPTVDEYMHRVRYMPENCVYTVSVMGPEQSAIALASIQTGGNVRVGTEDYPFIKADVPAKNNAEIVTRMSNVAREVGREVADSSEARKILGL
jgi:3-keto-5-aminohexanoate cleavage enzyme